MNLRTIETGSLVVHNALLIAETTKGHGLHLRIDPARPPPSIVCRHVQISPRTTYGDLLGIGEEITILVTNLVTDTTVQMTCRHFVTTVPKGIRGGLHMSTVRDLLRPLRLDLLEWIMLQHLHILPTMRRTASIPHHRHPQTPLPLPLQNDPCPRSINQYPSSSLQRNQSPPISVGHLRRLIPRTSPRTPQRQNQGFPVSLPRHYHHRNVQNERDVPVRKRRWLTVAHSQVAAQFTIMTLRPSWEKERLGKNFASTPRLHPDHPPVRFIKRFRKVRGTSLPSRGFSCTTRRKGCLSLPCEKSRFLKRSTTRVSSTLLT